jgi:hypothetical protein
MIQPFANILNHLTFSDGSMVEIKNRTLSATGRDHSLSLLEEIKIRIDLCLETQCKEDQHYYYILRAYCHVAIGEIDKAINATTYAIDGFRVCGLSWAQVIGHWFLGAIHASQRRGYLYLSEVNHAIGILEPIRQDFLIRGDYDEAAKCQELKILLETNKETALKMGTGPLHMPGNPAPTANPAPSDPTEGYLLIPWLPRYCSVQAGPQGIVWVEPGKESVANINKIFFDKVAHVIYPIKNTSSSDQQITLTDRHYYGWTKVNGHSMNNSPPHPICEGDHVLFHLHNNAQDRDIVIASHPTASGDLAYMVKRFRSLEMELVSESTDSSQIYNPIKLDQFHQILGIVLAVAKPIK